MITQWANPVVTYFGLKSRSEVSELVGSDPGFEPVIIDTFCSGSEAPIAGAYTVWPEEAIVHRTGCDNNALSKRWIAANFKPVHWDDSIDASVQLLRAEKKSR